MLRRVQHGRPRREGATLEHVRWNEAITHVAFGGRAGPAAASRSSYLVMTKLY